MAKMKNSNLRTRIAKLARTRSADIESNILSKYASRSEDAIRRLPEKVDVRPNYFHDTDRIIHSKSYTRYIDKTQVFYLFDNDDITHRVLHVQFVSKIARTIGRELSLNEDLIEAIALGHDIGHPPFGHEGEEYLDKLCVDNDIGHFSHCVQSVIFLDNIEKRLETKPLNLSLQVMDGILCHDGEIHKGYLKPKRNKSWKIHIDERKLKKKNKKTALRPMTLEGCVVRYADVIAYIGRDIEDAITLRLIKRDDLPKNITQVLGNNNRDIINTLVSDLIETSSKENDKICYSKKINKAIITLKEGFNYKKIYFNKKTKRESEKNKELYNLLFKTLLNDLKQKNSKSDIFTNWANIIDAKYINKCSHPEIVRDFIASLTDDYFISLFEKLFFPKRFGLYFEKEE